MASEVKPPRGTKAAGRRLWVSIVGEYDLEEHELVLLAQAVRITDLLTELDAAVRRDGPLVDGPQGMRAHPAAVESRQQSIALARLMGALRVPMGEESDVQASARPQRRVGARGVYNIGGGRS